MGQYYSVLFKGEGGSRKVYDPGSSLYMTHKGWDAARIAEFRESRHFTNEDGSVTFVPYPDEYYAFAYGMKLLENGTAGSRFVAAVVNALRDRPARVAWVGDYAEEDDDFANNPHYDRKDYEYVWEDDRDPVAFDAIPAAADGLRGFLVNHDKRKFVNLADTNIEENYVLHPLAGLSVIGNGRGGGDFYGTGMSSIGSWALDLLEVTDEAPSGYEKLTENETEFIEGY